LELHPSLQRQLLRRAIHRLRRSLRDIDWIHVEQARLGVERKSTGARVTLPQGLFLFKGYDEFTIGGEVPPPDFPLLVQSELPVTIPGTTPLPKSTWRLNAEILTRAQMPEKALDGLDPWQAYLDLERTGTNLVLRWRQAGDRFQPLGMGGKSKPLDEFMIDAKIPQRIRDQLPLLVSPRHIVWVAGWRPDERVKITEQTAHVLRLKFDIAG